MPEAEFYERQYELAVNVELVRGLPFFFAPTPGLEEFVGFDVAMFPADARIWPLLDLQPPRGVTMNPAMFARWPSGTSSTTLPPFAVSLFLQYKRPDYLQAASSGQWSTWHQPYYRISLPRPQFNRLAALERLVGTAAAVRYAAPVFWQNEDLWAHQLAQTVFLNSTFVAPSTIGTGHGYWTFVRAAGPGCAHSAEAEAPSQSAADLLHSVGERARSQGRRTLPDHVAELAMRVESIGLGPERPSEEIDQLRLPDDYLEPRFRQLGEERFAALTPEARTFFLNAERVSSAAAATGAMWVVVTLPPSDTEAGSSMEEQEVGWGGQKPAPSS